MPFVTLTGPAPDADHMNTLQLRYDVHDDRLTLRPFIDGHDLLRDHENDLGIDPDRLLPPLSSALLPTRWGHVVLVGSCGCGELGCGSLSVRLSRAGSEVLWQSEPAPHHETIARTYRFELQNYLDAVDDAVENPPSDEGRGRRVSRAVRLFLGLHDHAHERVDEFVDASVDWVSAWPWTGDVVRVSITTNGRQKIHEFAPVRGETEDEHAARIVNQIHRQLFDHG